MNNFFDLIEKRESCRNYSNKPVEKEKLISCIEAARIAPSACNGQPWRFIIINNKELSFKVAKCIEDLVMNKFTEKCPAFIIVLQEKTDIKARIGAKIKNQDYSSIDIGIASCQLCLEATEQGLSTCIMGWFNEKKLKNLLNIDPSKRIRLVISIGYSADTEIRKKIRKNIDEIAKFI
ncbi:NAD(P)H nitroreductase [Clostridium fermenticellae]|uniref:NAD(P)H nitroreductase n=1 Tax=Clostridium fermenticellae TaxID=2068654 RepID=A0A386H363_9CLOT|nr:nitroreductase family protein [Clostridium fermenticellae]AYD39983.1 NAD(P)H nitroreductase [Clostridium fermenticellae]